MPETILGTQHFDVTSWFGPSSTPAREGVYERLAPAGPFACWNGRAWNADAHAPADAAAQDAASAIQDAPWRGLTTEAGAPCATCKGHTVVDRGVDLDTDRDLIDECPDC